MTNWTISVHTPLDRTIIENKQIEEAIIAIETSEHSKINKIIDQLSGSGVNIKIIPDMYDILIWKRAYQQYFRGLTHSDQPVPDAGLAKKRKALFRHLHIASCPNHWLPCSVYHCHDRICNQQRSHLF